jgi:hypothetical protein
MLPEPYGAFWALASVMPFCNLDRLKEEQRKMNRPHFNRPLRPSNCPYLIFRRTFTAPFREWRQRGS